MNPSYRAMLSGFVAGASLAVSAAMFALYPDGKITAGIGVASPCGIYNIITVFDDGSVKQYPEGPPSQDVLRALGELPEDRQIFVIVPCPTMQLPQYEAQSQDQAESPQADAAPQGDGAHGA